MGLTQPLRRVVNCDSRFVFPIDALEIWVLEFVSGGDSFAASCFLDCDQFAWFKI